jgi:hypothetical protein
MTQEHGNTKHLTVRRGTFPSRVFQSLRREERSALLLLGLLLNEANWTRKLLAKASHVEFPPGPEQEANLGLMTMLGALLAAKIYEGWDTIRSGDIAHTLNTTTVPSETTQLRQTLEEAVRRGSIIYRIRNTFAFHYPQSLDVSDLDRRKQDDLAVLITGFAGDTYATMSTRATMEPLIALFPDLPWQEALTRVWNEALDASFVYCEYVSGLLAAVISKAVPTGLDVQNFSLTNQPHADDERITFFTLPPKNWRSPIE